MGALFMANLVVMAGALVLRVSGVQFPRGVLFGADLYWLNLYLVGLVISIHERRAASPNQPLQPTGPAMRGSAPCRTNSQRKLSRQRG